jgi:hypothetical protein
MRNGAKFYFGGGLNVFGMVTAVILSTKEGGKEEKTMDMN